jgi:ATP-dependent RNA helicase DDX23/PRP28
VSQHTSTVKSMNSMLYTRYSSSCTHDILHPERCLNSLCNVQCTLRKDERNGGEDRDRDRDEATIPPPPPPTTTINGDGTTRKQQPVSLEDRLKELKETKAAANKPVFLTKEERQKLALQRLEEQRAERAKQQDEARKVLDNMKDDMRSGKYSDRERREKERKEQERREEVAAQLLVSEKEVESVKARYLGEKKQKKKVIKMTDKTRFAFDWESTEDTSVDVNPLYTSKHQAQLLFGRGLRAGIDMREQKKSSTYVEQLEAVRAKQEEDMDVDDVDQEAAEARREEHEKLIEQAYASRAKASEDKNMRLPGKHWSEKKLEEMSIRDWRIFREDFKIATRGGKVGVLVCSCVLVCLCALCVLYVVYLCVCAMGSM